MAEEMEEEMEICDGEVKICRCGENRECTECDYGNETMPHPKKCESDGMKFERRSYSHVKEVGEDEIIQ